LSQQSPHPQSFIESSFCRPDAAFEVPIRPALLADFIGQQTVRSRLDVLVGAAQSRNETLGHCLFYGPPGLGKTTLAHIISKAMGTQLIVTSGPAIEKAGDLAGMLTKLQPGDVLFIDEIHRLGRAIEEYLYPAMEDFKLDLVIDSGNNASSVQVKLHPFTLVGATTRAGMLSAPLRSRFALTCRLDYYEQNELAAIVERTAHLLNVSIDSPSCIEIARRSRGTPRIANNLVRWTRDYAAVRADGIITHSVAVKALDMLDIDSLGLDAMDCKILEAIIDIYNGGPVGINALAITVGEDPSTLEEVYEPYLILQGLIRRTPRGREVTPQAYSHLRRAIVTSN
jgi:Holliday junction DNA helicase RuvB